MFVVATAGHVDHGKSTLVRALTGMEPDRHAEEKRRGMTIDLGYAWTALPGGEQVAFVDVPGHQRFIGTMLAGVGPTPAVLMVVAADEGWRRQSGEHLAAIQALRVARGLLVITRTDLADPSAALEQARTELASTGLAGVEAVTVSATTGQGMDELRAALARLAHRLPRPDPLQPVRFWIDRSFTVAGTGTVVTGTLGAGTIRIGDELDLAGEAVAVRGLQQTGRSGTEATGVARVALNLRSVARAAIGRGDVLLTPGAWRRTEVVDVELDSVDTPSDLVLHVGTAAVAVHLRPLAGRAARLTLQRPLPLRVGDRAILRDPGRQAVAGGVRVLDAEPPALRRRGSARRRGLELAAGPPDVHAEVARRGAVRAADLARLGIDVAAAQDAHGWLVDPSRWSAWQETLCAVVDDQARTLEPGLPEPAAVRALDLPDVALLADVVRRAGLTAAGGRIVRPGTVATLGAAEPAVAALEARLSAHAFDSPDRAELDALGLGPRPVAAAVRAGRLIDLGGVLLLPGAPDQARKVLAGLIGPFTTSEARLALGTTRRVVVPLLEHLDRLGITVRIDASRRRLVQKD